MQQMEAISVAPTLSTGSHAQAAAKISKYPCLRGRAAPVSPQSPLASQGVLAAADC